MPRISDPLGVGCVIFPAHLREEPYKSRGIRLSCRYKNSYYKRGVEKYGTSGCRSDGATWGLEDGEESIYEDVGKV